MIPRPPSSTLFPYTTLFRSEIALLVANLVPNQPAIEFQASLPLTEIESANRFWLSGMNMNYAAGKLLWKGDIAYKTDQIFYEFQLPVRPVYKDVIDIAIGVEYTEQKSTVDFSATRTLILNWQDTLLSKRQSGLFLLSWSTSYLHEEVSFSAVTAKLHNESSYYAFISTDYAIDDHLSMIATYFWFDIESTNIQLSTLNDNDRISLKIKYQM